MAMGVIGELRPNYSSDGIFADHNADLDARAVAGRRLNRDLAAEKTDALLHADETKT
jgi:hypothetical protein